MLLGKRKNINFDDLPCNFLIPCFNYLFSLSRLELDEYISTYNNTENTGDQEDNSTLTAEENEIPLPLKKAYLIYQQASEHIRDIKFIIHLLNIIEKYDNTENLQKKITRYKYMERMLKLFF